MPRRAVMLVVGDQAGGSGWSQRRSRSPCCRRPLRAGRGQRSRAQAQESRAVPVRWGRRRGRAPALPVRRRGACSRGGAGRCRSSRCASRGSDGRRAGGAADAVVPVLRRGQRRARRQHRVVGLAQVRGEQPDHVRRGRVRGHLVHRVGDVAEPAPAAKAGQLVQEERRVLDRHRPVVAAKRPAVHAGRRASRDLDHHVDAHKTDDRAAFNFPSKGNYGEPAASSSRTSGAAGRLSAAPVHGGCGR
jgi:hypothetical protein